ncbi:VWA domain-containing protein [Candidatus Magnetaquicoccus inordinatus]|uniref:VWA domain-containing protein n=1 Tax=Candidatus Magnetaquicoccus inordinatus TaxID=2496818 RepID=UPI00102B8430|nr:VWA domain-containing protein [Candidatus Magnetaquicoccus inordinatus]
MIDLAWPWGLLFLPLPWMGRWLLPAVPPSGKAALHIPGAALWHFPARTAPAAHSRSPLLWLRTLALLTWILLVLAACQPQWLGEALPVASSGRDLLLAVDLSGSMETRDFILEKQTVDRLTAIKQVAGAFIERRHGDRVGLILFGSNAYLQAPFTFDRRTVQTFLAEAVIGLPGKETAIGDAIALAVKKSTEIPASPAAPAASPVVPAQRRVLLLLTDGANNAGQITPLQAAQLAATAGLRIYTIGIGADELQIRTLFGTRTVNPSADLDEEALTAIATRTGGRYFRARDTIALQEIHQLLDQLEPVVQEAQRFRPFIPLFHWPLAVALFLGAGLCTWEALARPWR